MYYLSSQLTKTPQNRATLLMMAGRLPLTVQDLQDRVAAYCKRYDVAPGPDGLPPYPSGQRETAQHREWIAVYKAHRRLRHADRS
jgi:hypothetical protein